MKRKILSALLVAALFCTLAATAGAVNMGQVGERCIVSVGSAHTALIDNVGTLWMWGDNGYGQLGVESDVYTYNPVRVMDHVFSVSCSGGNAYDYTIAGNGLVLAKGHTAAIDDAGTLWTWGFNGFGQLGSGTTQDSKSPVAVMDGVEVVSCGGNHTAVIKKDGSLWAWGDNRKGQLGNGTTTSASAPVWVLDNVTAVSCGGDHTAAITSDGALWVWGDLNGAQRLGKPTRVLENVAAVDCGVITHAITSDRVLWRIDRSDSITKVMEDVVDVSYGTNHGAAITSDGTLYTWGTNDDGQLGTGSSSSSSTPRAVLNDVATIGCGYTFNVAVKRDGTVWSWGANNRAQLGYTATNGTRYDETDQSVPKQIASVTAPKGVQLLLNGGLGGGRLWTNVDSSLQVPANPSREGYTFGGWYTDAALTTPWNFNDQVINTVTLYAKWVPVSSTATTTGKSSQSITLNGEVVTLDAYTLRADNGGDVTYVKLRDVAAILENTSAKCNVDWRRGAIYISTKTDYTSKNGTELKALTDTDGSYKWNTAPVLFDGVTKALEGIVLTDGAGGGHTFFKLRDLGDSIGFDVSWSAERGIYIETE